MILSALCGKRFLVKPPNGAARYFAGSATQREIAVTIFRGAKRTDSATSQFLNPEIASVGAAMSKSFCHCFDVGGQQIRCGSAPPIPYAGYPTH